MAQLSCLDALSELRNPASLESQIRSLKHLKNAVIGHAEKKEELVRNGLVDVLAYILRSTAKSRGKRKDPELDGGGRQGHGKAAGGAREDEVRLQAILLLSSLAHEGLAYVAPILAGSAVPLLIAALSPTETSPKIVTSSLRALLYLAKAGLSKVRTSEALQLAPALDTLYSKASIQLFADILGQKSDSTAAQSQIALLCQLIDVTCYAEQNKDALISGGVLDLLAARLASYHAHQRLCPVRINSSLASALPPQPSCQIVPHILDAIIRIIHQSAYRIARLLFSPPVILIFPFHKPDAHSEASGNIGHQSSVPLVSPLELSLPHIYQASRKDENGFNRAFPALGSAQSAVKTVLMDFGDGSNTSDGAAQPNVVESSLVSWLLLTVRSEQGLLRLSASTLLATINAAGLLNKSRGRILALVVVPLLVGMIEEKPSTRSLGSGSPKTDLEALTIKEQAPQVLTRLISGNVPLTKAAVDAGALKKVSLLLKQTFDPLDPPPPTWAPSSSFTSSTNDIPASCRLEGRGLRPDFMHLLRCRTSALNLIAALADKDDGYKKQLTESGVVPYIIDSLMPLKQESEYVGKTKQKIQTASLGNSIAVLLAACDATRALSRSVSLLRTSLMDATLAKPISALLKLPNVAVIRAATDVICNLITDFSPMREDLLEAGAIKTLCEHAHSADSSIRFVSLWALKHLMYNSPTEVKMTCFEELGSGWLVRIITGGASAPPLSKSSLPLTMGAANAAGERIDILNAVDESMDTTEDEVADDSIMENMSSDMATESDSAVFPDNSPEFVAIVAQYRDRLEKIKDHEDCVTAAQEYANELKTQAQGLDIVRNMIAPPKAEDMIDTLFDTLGADCIFEMVASKIKWPPSSLIHSNGNQPQNGYGNGNSNSASADANSTPPTPSPLTGSLIDTANLTLLESAINILVHIGASAPRHRAQLISQPILLSSLLKLLSHTEPTIRTACVWVAINLTWVDDQSDAMAARGRAAELRRLGWEGRLWLMANGGEEDRDCRERVATACEQMRELVDGGGSGVRR